MVKLFRLSPNDTGLYRCGIGDRNDKLFFRMNLNVSPGKSRLTADGSVFVKLKLRRNRHKGRLQSPRMTRAFHRGVLSA